MATMITEECINCGVCEFECPNQGITEDEDAFVIDPALCSECVGFHDTEQCAAVCPVDCCVPDPNRVETEPTLFASAQKITRIGRTSCCRARRRLDSVELAETSRGDPMLQRARFISPSV
jgi:ferredoxin